MLLFEISYEFIKSWIKLEKKITHLNLNYLQATKKVEKCRCENFKKCLESNFLIKILVVCFKEFKDPKKTVNI